MRNFLMGTRSYATTAWQRSIASVTGAVSARKTARRAAALASLEAGSANYVNKRWLARIAYMRARRLAAIYLFRLLAGKTVDTTHRD